MRYRGPNSIVSFYYFTADAAELDKTVLYYIQLLLFDESF